MRFGANWALFAFLLIALPVQSFAAAQEETVKHFLARCARDDDACAEAFLYLVLVDVKLCGESRVESIVQWLNAHPETHSMKIGDGMVKAFKALYSCPR